MATALLSIAASAQAEHFQYRVDLAGLYSGGGSEGCFPPDFNQPACPREGSLTAILSFDTPSGDDGSYLIADSFGDITNFYVNLGGLPGDSLFGAVNLNAGVPNGSVQASDQSETFTFDWATRSASYIYDFGYHNPYGNFAGTLSSVPEPSLLALLLAGCAGFAWTGRRRAGAAKRS